MSKKKRRQRKRKSPEQKRRFKVPVIVLAAAALSLVIGVVAGWRVLSGTLNPFAPRPPQTSYSASNPSKEYVYAGGRMIATEEPASGGGSLAPPTSLVADTATSASINITWSASTGAAHYVVERSQSINGPFTPLTPEPTTTSFNDTSVTSGAAYLYRVRAVDAANNLSAYSNIDLATAVTFTDDPLVANSTTIKAQHLTELRQAVNAVRALAGLNALQWTDSSPSGVTFKKAHILELRTGLDEALTALSFSTQAYTDPNLPSGTTVRKIHFDELRQRVK